MNKLIKILLLFSLSLVASHAFAQSPYYNNGIYSEPVPDVLLPVKDALARAKEADAKKKFNEAIEELTNANSTQPDQAYLFYARGSEYCNQALELDARGKALVEGEAAKRLYRKAIEDYTKSLALEPEKALYYYRRGNSYLLLGEDSPAALSDFSNAINLEPGNAGYYAARARCYGATRQYEKALTDYQKAISLHTDNAEQYAERAALYAKTGNYDKALKDYDQALSLNPDNAHCYAERGLLYQFKKEYSNMALDDFGKAISLDPGEVLFYSYRGACYRSVNKLLKARDDLSKSCEGGIKSDCEELSEINRDITRGDNWIYAGSTAHTNYYYDSSTVIDKNRNAVTVWTRMERKGGEDGNSSAVFYENRNDAAVRDRPETKRVQDNAISRMPPLFAVMYSSYNCATRESADIQMVRYNESGFVLSSQIYSSLDYARIVPGSIGEILMNSICSDSKTPEKITKTAKKSASKEKRVCRTVCE